jgi:hypothetical protein
MTPNDNSSCVGKSLLFECCSGKCSTVGEVSSMAGQRTNRADTKSHLYLGQPGHESLTHTVMHGFLKVQL